MPTRPKKHCDPREIALKSFFLGPQAENSPWVRSLLVEVLETWFRWRRGLFPQDGVAISRSDQGSVEFEERRTLIREKTLQLVERFEAEVPKFSPRYIGHMFSEVSLPALFGHIVTLLHNPNNISSESSRVGVELEDEAINELLKMLGLPSTGFGHFTSGGTLANIEALLRARARIAEDSRPRAVLLVPRNMHYSWKKGLHLLGLPPDSLWAIDLDAQGHLDVASLERLLQRARSEARPILMVVSVLGTTELGGIDPIHGVQDVLDRWQAEHHIRIWHHIDAAYGGFFRTLDLESCTSIPPSARLALRAVPRATSLTIDPHKLGYVPYASGAILVRDRTDYGVGATPEAPYIDFDQRVDRGPYTLEGSRSAAGAVATWMTAHTMGFHPQGYGLLLDRTTRISRNLEEQLRPLPLQLAPGCDTNLVCFSCAREGEALSRSNQRTLAVYEKLSPRGESPFMVSKTTLRRESFGRYMDEWTKTWHAQPDVPEIVLIRMCLMNPFFGSAETHTPFAEALTSELQTLLGRMT